jgi:glucose 1-dehydrogenase
MPPTKAPPTAYLTGCARGIGRACALELARRGYAIVGLDLLPAGTLADEAAALGSQVITLQADVTDPDAHQRAVALAVERFGRLDAVVANAAWSHRKPFLEMPLDMARKTVEVTMWGAFHAFQHGGRQLARQREGGAMVAISSVHVARPFPLSTAYNMAKAGVNHMALTAAAELAPQRIRVNLVEPGWTDTPGERMHFTDQQIEEGARDMPFGRLASPAEIAKGVAWLLSDDADYVSGTVLRIDGALVLPKPVISS